MFGKTRYIEWAMRFYGKVSFDLATSGIPLAALEPPGDLADPKGYEGLSRAIAEYNHCDLAEVVPALGTSQGIFLAYASACVPGDEVLVETPGYEPMTRTAEGLGITVRTFERPESERYRVLPERVATAMTPRTRVVSVTNLHNPSGVRTDDETLRELARICEARGAYLLVDEVYAPFDDLIPSRSARALAPNVIAIASLTKCYGLGMQRIGWLLGPADVVERAHSAVLSTCGHLPLSHANLGVAAFASLPKLADRAKGILAKKRDLAAQWVASLPNARWSAPTEGLFGCVTLDTKEDLRPRIEAAATDHGVLVAPGSFFGVPNGFRLSWASCDEARFTEGLALLRGHVVAVA